MSVGGHVRRGRWPSERDWVRVEWSDGMPAVTVRHFYAEDDLITAVRAALRKHGAVTIYDWRYDPIHSGVEGSLL